MRYIANSDGYLQEVSFGAEVTCGDQSCTEYTGSVPTGYDTLEDWYIDNIEKIYQWKIVNGNLTQNSSATAQSDLPALDWVTEQGTSGMWKYRIWFSGFAECWGRSPEITADVSTAWGSLYTTLVSSEFAGPYDIPFVLTDLQMQIRPCYSGGDYWLSPVNKGDGSSTTMAYRPIRATAKTDFTYAVDIYITGNLTGT